MQRLQFREILPYTAADLMDLAMDPSQYAGISDFVKGVSVRETGPGRKQVETTIETPVIPVAIRYGCTLERVPPDAIRAVATRSPFRSFSGSLRFATLPDGQTEVGCDLAYETGWNPVAVIAARVMESQIRTAIGYARAYLAERLTPVGAAVSPAAPVPSAPPPPVPG